MDINIIAEHGYKKILYQWDINRRVKITGEGNELVSEVHFGPLVVRPISADGYLTADIPNILLQSADHIKVYLVLTVGKEKYTLGEYELRVIAREKPDDYVYTETEVLRYEALEKRVSELEQSGGGGGTGGITKETDPTVPDWAKKPEKPTYTAEEVGALPEDTEIPDLTELENRVSELERGVANWEKVAEIPMNTETVIYELASVKEYPEVLVMIKRTYQAGNTASGNVGLALRNLDLDNSMVYYIGSGFNNSHVNIHAVFNGGVVEVCGKNSNNKTTGSMIYTTFDDYEKFADTGMYALVMTLSWAQTILEGDTISVYGKRRS